MMETTTLSQCNHQNVLLNSTNVLLHTHSNALQEDAPSKRRPPTPDGSTGPTPAKRPCLTHPSGKTRNEEGTESRIQSHTRRHTIFSLFQSSRLLPSRSLRFRVPSRLILQSFVSSCTLDEFKFTSLRDTLEIPPYACAYSYSAKGNGASLLAVATEEGTVSILNTSRRCEWDFVPQRTIFQPHDNGIFDIKWSLDDTKLATASGDKTTRICSIETQNLLHVLRAHTSTLKCIAWDPSHRDILSTGGRDGKICLWDLRMTSSREDFGGGVPALQPVVAIHDAHGQRKSTGGRKKVSPLPRSVTSMLYAGVRPYTLISSGSFDGILNLWDFRLPVLGDPAGDYSPCASSPFDVTTMNGSGRARGISSLCAGSGPTSGLLFALGADSRLYTFSSPSLMALDAKVYTNLRTSFDVRLASSPCGRWLASGCSERNGGSFLFDASNAARLSTSSLSQQSPEAAVELQGQGGEVHSVDWAREMVATCADNGTVRVWRPNYDVYQKCLSAPDADRWSWSRAEHCLQVDE